MLNKIEFTVDQSSLNRLDKLLCLHLPELSRSKLAALIENGNVLVNGKIVSKNYRIKLGDRIEVLVPEAREYEAVSQNIPIQIVYEDNDIVIVNKEKGMVVHPAHGNYDGTLVNALLYHCGNSLSGINGVMRPGIVHRIDKDTSGLIVIAKNDKAHGILSNQFEEHSIEREYHAIVFGNVKADSGTINKPIGRHPTDRKKMACNVLHAKSAVTHFKVIERFNGFTYIKCKLETGRTHQIRVHMADMGHFVLGDLVYGRKIKKVRIDFEGQCLHAKTLGFVHPSTGEFVRFDSELPTYFSNLLERIKNI